MRGMTLEALEDSKQSLFEQYIMGEIDVETYKTEKAACDAAILKAKNAYAAIAAQAKKKKEEQNRQSSRTEVAKAITNAEGLTPELVSLLIEKVYIFPDKRIEIAYKVHDLFDWESAPSVIEKAGIPDHRSMFDGLGFLLLQEYFFVVCLT